MTYRERRLAKAERLRGWADKRVSDATAALATGDQYRGDIAFNTQPGHIPERARLIAREDRAFASLAKADSMASRADSIEAAADHAIYSDDPDAIPALEARIADLSARLASRKDANAAYRAAHRADLAAMTPYERSQAVPYPSYSISNLSGNIARQRSRLADLRNPRARIKWFVPDRRGLCLHCGEPDEGVHVPHPTVPSLHLCPTVID